MWKKVSYSLLLLVKAEAPLSSVCHSLPSVLRPPSSVLQPLSPLSFVLHPQAFVLCLPFSVLRPPSSVIHSPISVLRPLASVLDLRPPSSVIHSPPFVLFHPPAVLRPSSSVLHPPSSFGPSGPSPAPLKQQTVIYFPVMCKQTLDKNPLRPASGVQQGEAFEPTAAQAKERGGQQRTLMNTRLWDMWTGSEQQMGDFSVGFCGSAGLMIQPLMMWLDVPVMDECPSRR